MNTEKTQVRYYIRCHHMHVRYDTVKEVRKYCKAKTKIGAKFLTIERIQDYYEKDYIAYEITLIDTRFENEVA